MLGTLLLVPVLVFLFLMRFGVNNFSLRTYFPTKVDSTLVEGKWQYDTVYHSVPDFHLLSQTGEKFSQANLQGDIYVASLFFASCKVDCQQMNEQLSRVQDAFRFNPRIKLVSITVDPTRDSLEVLQQYAARFGAKKDQWFFLTGAKNEIYALANNGLQLPVKDIPVDSPDFYHSEKFVLIDKARKIRGIYDGVDPKDVDRLMTEINVLLAEYENNHGK